MDYTIIDAHAHLWLRQDTVVDGLPIRLWKMVVRNLWEKSGKWFRPL